MRRTRRRVRRRSLIWRSVRGAAGRGRGCGSDRTWRIPFRACARRSREEHVRQLPLIHTGRFFRRSGCPDKCDPAPGFHGSGGNARSPPSLEGPEPWPWGRQMPWNANSCHLPASSAIRNEARMRSSSSRSSPRCRGHAVGDQRREESAEDTDGLCGHGGYERGHRSTMRVVTAAARQVCPGFPSSRGTRTTSGPGPWSDVPSPPAAYVRNARCPRVRTKEQVAP
jgi:hypothetical protein